MKSGIILILICSLIMSCKNNSADTEEEKSKEALYVLPYPVGKTYNCSQGFNGSFSHYGVFRYSVDFDLPLGTLVTAARTGRVYYIRENFSDDDHTVGHENIVIVKHEDNTYARYTHLTTNGALVKINQIVEPGDTIGLSGNTGHSIMPHLHFDVTAASTGREDQTIPFYFKNIQKYPFGIHAGIMYTALKY